MSNTLEHKIRTYLAGPIGEVSLKKARDWRKRVAKNLALMGIAVLNPLDKEHELPVRRRLFSLGKNGDIDTLRQLAHSEFVKPDLEMVKHCAFITFKLPKEDNAEICGSFGEITCACLLDIPVYIVTDRRLKPLNVPYWAVGCSTKIFSTWQEYYKYVKEEWIDKHVAKDDV